MGACIECMFKKVDNTAEKNMRKPEQGAEVATLRGKSGERREKSGKRSEGRGICLKEQLGWGWS